MTNEDKIREAVTAAHNDLIDALSEDGAYFQGFGVERAKVGGDDSATEQLVTKNKKILDQRRELARLNEKYIEVKDAMDASGIALALKVLEIEDLNISLEESKNYTKNLELQNKKLYDQVGYQEERSVILSDEYATRINVLQEKITVYKKEMEKDTKLLSTYRAKVDGLRVALAERDQKPDGYIESLERQNEYLQDELRTYEPQLRARNRQLETALENAYAELKRVIR